VGRLSPIVEALPNSEERPCWARYGLTTPEADYQTCVSNALTDSLHDLFAQISDEPARHIDAMIIPAVATGVGKLTKAAFYNKLLVDVLVEELKKDYALPATLYLQVRRWENPNRWPETQTAIASAVAKAVSTWAQSEHKSAESEWLSLTGVAAGSCVILLLMASGLSVAFLSDLMPLVQRPSPLLY
jgi:hypothetical protein